MDVMSEEDVERLLTDPFNGLVAPSISRKPLSRLSGGAVKVVVSTCSMSSTGDVTSWDVMWLTPKLLVVASASKTQTSLWTASSKDQEPDEFDVWARSLDGVRSVAFKDVIDRTAGSRDGSQDALRRGSSARRAVREVYEVRFEDGTAVQIPAALDHGAGPVADQPSLALLEQLSALL